MKIIEYLERQIVFSEKTFGHGVRTEGICRHIESELSEIRVKPHDLMEWIDVIILSLDGAWRAGYSPIEICEALQKKQDINLARKWPSVKPGDEPMEHIREHDEPKREKCKQCHGSKHASPNVFDATPCPNCHGTGNEPTPEKPVCAIPEEPLCMVEGPNGHHCVNPKDHSGPHINRHGKQWLSFPASPTDPANPRYTRRSRR